MGVGRAPQELEKNVLETVHSMFAGIHRRRLYPPKIKKKFLFGNGT